MLWHGFRGPECLPARFLRRCHVASSVVLAVLANSRCDRDGSAAPQRISKPGRRLQRPDPRYIAPLHLTEHPPSFFTAASVTLGFGKRPRLAVLSCQVDKQFPAPVGANSKISSFVLTDIVFPGQSVSFLALPRRHTRHWSGRLDRRLETSINDPQSARAAPPAMRCPCQARFLASSIHELRTS